jgi:hypothetical protein
VAGTETLAKLKVEGGRMVLPGGMAYRVLVLPERRAVTVATLRELRALVEGGATVVVNGPAPEGTPGLTDAAAADAEVKKLGAELWGNLDGKAVTEHAVGKGRVVWGKGLGEVLTGAGAPADVEVSSRSGNAAVHWIHRHVGENEVYFVANRGEKAEEVVCSFHVSGKRPELWDAVTGRSGAAQVWEQQGNRERVALQLEGSGSVFVVFRPGAAGEGVASVASGGKVLAEAEMFGGEQRAATIPAGRQGATGQQMVTPMPNAEAPPALELTADGGLLAWADGQYVLKSAAGKERTVGVTGIHAAVEVGGPWQVTFPPKLGAPASATFEKLVSWTERPEEGIKYFSGTATYQNKFTVPAEMIGEGKRVFLDLGKVDYLADVVVNGKELGVQWKAPFRVDVTEAVKAGENALEVRVTNLWVNRLIGDEKLPVENEYATQGTGASITRPGSIVKMPAWYVEGKPKPEGGRVTFTTWKHYTAESPLAESGLIGPVVVRGAVPVK